MTGCCRFVFMVFVGLAACSAGLIAENTVDPRIAHVVSELEQVRKLQQTALSPDGRMLAWVVGEQPATEIRIAPVADPSRSRRLSAGSGAACLERELAWSPNSKELAFLSNCNAGGSGQEDVYLSAPGTANGTPRRLTHLHGGISNLSYSPDGLHLGYLYIEGATRPAGALAAMKPPSGEIGVEGLEIQRLAIVEVASGSVQLVSPATLHVYEYGWAPDSTQLVYTAAIPPGENNWWVAQLYTQTRSGGLPVSILDPEHTPGAMHGLQMAVPRWSPDGQEIAFIGGLMSDQGATGGDIYLLPATGGTLRNLTLDGSGSAVWLDWRKNAQLLVSSIRSGEVEWSELSTADGKVIHDYGKMAATVWDGRLEQSLSLSSDGHVAFLKSSFSDPPEVYLGQLGAGAQAVTQINAAYKAPWGKAESVHWTSDGLAVQGWLLYPAHYDAARKYPLIVSVHGGPSAAMLPHWPDLGYNPIAFSALDYFVLMPNPRGSYGQGEAFTQANRKDFGYGDLRDILAGVDAVSAQVSIDAQRVGLTGWSYGGFMTMFAVTQTQRFHAAVAGAGISDWKSYYGENSIDQWMTPFFGATVYDDPAVYAKSSAIDYIQKVKTPTLVVVGDRDGECPAPQSFEFWHALRAQHVPTRLVVYPDEGHHFESPQHRRDVLARALAWFEQYMPPQG